MGGGSAMPDHDELSIAKAEGTHGLWCNDQELKVQLLGV
jgi:hypothetical protein